MSYLDQLTNEQRAVLLNPMDWSKTAQRLAKNLEVAKPKYRAGIEQMIRIANVKATHGNA